MNCCRFYILILIWKKSGENDTAKLMENVLCGFLEDGFEELAALYLNHFDEAAVNEGKKNGVNRLQVRTLQAQQCLRWLYLHRFLQSEKNGKEDL